MYDNNRGGGNRRNGSGGFDRRGQNQMHDAVCAKCGGNCKVPFMPTSGKPVFCSDCFESQGGGKNRGNDRRGGGNRDFSGKRNFSDRPSRPPAVDYTPQLEAISNKLDAVLEMLVIQKIKKTEETEQATE